MTETIKKEHWIKLVTDWETSGVSQRAFCKSHNIDYSQFCYWRYEFNKAKKKKLGTFVPVKVERSPKKTEPLTVSLGCKLSIIIEDESHVALAAKLVKALR